jgi:molybdenum cofactor cytidylyltransferase
MKFSAVVLAAGTSSRMQGRHKLLLPVGDETVIRRTVRQVLASGAEEVIVVTGFRGREVLRELMTIDDERLRYQANPRYEEGQMSSVGAGCAALLKPCDAVMVCLGDMLLLAPADYAALAEAYAATDRNIVVPMHAGQRGNPVLFAASFVPEVVSGRRHMGCRKLIAEHPDEVFAFQAPDARYSVDLDTPADYERLLARLQQAEPQS